MVLILKREQSSNRKALKVFSFMIIITATATTTTVSRFSMKGERAHSDFRAFSL